MTRKIFALSALLIFCQPVFADRPASRPSGNPNHAFYSQAKNGWTGHATGNTSSGADDIFGSANAVPDSVTTLSNIAGFVCNQSGAAIPQIVLDGSQSGYTILVRAKETAAGQNAGILGDGQYGANILRIDDGSGNVRLSANSVAGVFNGVSGGTSSTTYAFCVATPAGGCNQCTLYTQGALGSQWTQQGTDQYGGGGVYFNLTLSDIGKPYFSNALWMTGSIECIAILKGVPPTLSQLNASGNAGFADIYDLFAPVAALTVSPNDIPANHKGPITITGTLLSGSYTGSETITQSGVTGISKVSQSFPDSTHFELVLSPPGVLGANPPGNIGTITVSDGTNTSTVTVDAPILSLNPSSALVNTQTNVTAIATHTIFTRETAAGLFAVSGGTGASVSSPPTINSDTSAAFTLTSGSAAGSLTITDTSTGATAAFTVDPSPPPTPGTASLASVGLGTVSFACTAASGGTPPITYQWYGSATPGFSVASGTLISGATSLSVSQNGLTNGAPYFALCLATDSSGAQAASNQVAGVPVSSIESYGFIGDSITFGSGLSAGQDPPSRFAAKWLQWKQLRTVNVSNRGQSGTQSYQWVSGSVYLNGAISAFGAMSPKPTYVFVMLGTNDSIAHIPAATYGSNIASLCNALVSNGYRPILSYPIYSPQGALSGQVDAQATALLVSYQPQIDSTIDGVNVLRGDTAGYDYFINNTATALSSDLVHPNATGADVLGGELWLYPLAKIAP